MATVSDRPITTFDISQRAKLLKVMRGANVTKKQAFQSLVDDVVKREEARKIKAEVTDAMIDQQLERMAKNSGATVDALAKRFKSQGVSLSALKYHISAQLAFNRIMGSKGVKPTADQAKVDKKYAELKADFARIAKDPRMKPVTVYKLQEILMPVEQEADSILINARAAEAQQFVSRYKGCSSAKAAASGIFNVKIGKTLEADGSKLPKQIRAALDKSGPGRVLGPMRTKGGLQLLGYCGKRSIAPKMPDMPSREAIERSVYNEQFDDFEATQLQDLRKSYVIDYKDASYSQ